MAVDVGMAAPDFSLYDADRKATSLSDFPGKERGSGILSRRFHRSLHHRDVRVSGPHGWAELVERPGFGHFSGRGLCSKGRSATRNNLNFPLLSDFQREAVNQYDLAIPNFAGMEGYTASKRAVYVVDGEGVVRYAWVGPNPGVEPDYDEVQAELGKLSG